VATARDVGTTLNDAVGAQLSDLVPAHAEQL
jgi:hypothetical protein